MYTTAFSLPELVVALTLVGILTTLGVSRYNAYVAKARQAEAKVNLSHIASLQGIYRSQHLKYKALSKVGAGTCAESVLNNELGFRPQGCDKLRYGYTSSGGTSGFTATAQSQATPSDKKDLIYPGCEQSDTWTIDQDLTLKNKDPSVIKKCSE